MAIKHYLPKGLVRSDVPDNKKNAFFSLEKWLSKTLSSWGISMFKECCTYPTDAMFIPKGTTAQRPTLIASESAIRYNTTTSKFEAWDGAAWQNLN